MSRKIARITQDKKLLLANEVVESNAKTSLKPDGVLETPDIIEYPAELEGGRNLLRDTALVHEGKGAWANLPTIKTDDIYPYVVQGYSWGIRYVIPFISKGTYTFSVKCKSDTLGNRGRIRKSGLGGNHHLGWTTDEWETYSATFTIFEDSEDIGFYLLAESGSSPIRWTQFKLERGNKPTDWTPAPEDLGLNYSDNIQSFGLNVKDNNSLVTSEFIEGYPFVKPVIDDSLVLWLDGSTGNNYDKTGTWKDLSGNGNDGELVDFGYTEDSGWGNGGLKFDGVDDYVDCGNDDSLNITEDLTIEILAYVPEDGIFGGVVKGNAGGWINNSYGLRVYYGNCRFYIADGNNISDRDIVIPKGELVSIVGTTSKTSGTMKGYRNGVLVSNGERQIKDIQVQQNGLYVGMGYTTALTKGNIFLVRIYNRALTDEEILQNYQAGQCSPLLAMRGDLIG